jgi:surfeit locus 1 family protein
VKRLAFVSLCLAFATTFAALGVWQLDRLHWKLALIDRVETRLAAPPRPAPAWSTWSADDSYTRVQLGGVFLHERETLVQAVTELGPGWWLMTPLRTKTGVVLINRGFVPSQSQLDESRSWSRPNGEVLITGLLRESEPRGGFLRTNMPVSDRWYSRDVEAIANARGLSGPVAPFFIDVDASGNSDGYPVGGLTVVQFRNSHLTYGLIWLALAALSLGGAVFAALPRKGGSALV